MEIRNEKTKISISRGERHTLGNCISDTVIHCHAGELWITFAGDREDHILTGESSRCFVNKRHGIISALTDAAFSIERRNQ